jgi:hypothetical protein
MRGALGGGDGSGGFFRFSRPSRTFFEGVSLHDKHGKEVPRRSFRAIGAAYLLTASHFSLSVIKNEPVCFCMTLVCINFAVRKTT